MHNAENYLLTVASAYCYSGQRQFGEAKGNLGKQMTLANTNFRPEHDRGAETSTLLDAAT
jgi:hypothetical protein